MNKWEIKNEKSNRKNRITSCRTRFGISRVGKIKRLLAKTLEILNNRKIINSLRSFNFSGFQHDVSAYNDAAYVMNDRRSRCAFSLVEAMIILVLISVAIMMLIPLMMPQKVSIPIWHEFKNDAGNTRNIYYGSGANERVGIGGANPYDSENKSKLAVKSLAVKNTADITSILWGESFISDSYCGYTAGNCSASDNDRLVAGANSIQLGMNTCSDANGNKIIINSNRVDDDNPLPACTANSININNQIFHSGNSIYISNGGSELTSASAPLTNIHAQIHDNTDTIIGRSLIFIHNAPNVPENGKARDYFRINFPIKYTAVAGERMNTPAIIYNGGAQKLALLPEGGTVTVNGMVILNEYTASETDNTGFNVLCDRTKISDIPLQYRCERFIPDYKAYRDAVGNDDDTGFSITFGLGFLGNNGIETVTKKTWNQVPATPSDIRLKNILSEYTKGIAEILKVDTYTYSYKNDKENKTFVGIIAQKLKGIFDEALHKDEKGYYSYERTPLLYAMTNSVKDINTKQKNIENQQKETSKEADRLIRMYK